MYTFTEGSQKFENDSLLMFGITIQNQFNSVEEESEWVSFDFLVEL